MMQKEKQSRIEQAEAYELELLQVVKWVWKQEPENTSGMFVDKAQNTDCLLPDGTRICFRVRSMKYLNVTDISFRDTPRGREYDKFIKGWGDYYLYCWGDTKIESFLVVDLNKLRASDLSGRVDTLEFSDDKKFKLIDIAGLDCIVYGYRHHLYPDERITWPDIANCNL